MSRPSKPKATAPAAAPEIVTAAPAPVTPDPASPQVPETTGAEAALAATVAAPVEPHMPTVAGASSEEKNTGAILVETVRVKGPAKGRWRAGRHFGPEPVDIAPSDLTREQLQRIFDDPELTVMVNGEA
jgi:hypothetical protein